MSSIFNIYDLINIILSFSEPEYYVNLAPVCKLWNKIINKNKLLYFQKLLPENLLPEKFKFVWVTILQKKILFPDFGYKCLASVFLHNVHLNYIIKKHGVKIGIKGNITLDNFQKLTPYCLQIYNYKKCDLCNNNIITFNKCDECMIKSYEEKNIRIPFLINEITNIKLMIKINNRHFLKGQYYYDPLKNPSLCKETEISLLEWLSIHANDKQIHFIKNLNIKK